MWRISDTEKKITVTLKINKYHINSGNSCLQFGLETFALKSSVKTRRDELHSVTVVGVKPDLSPQGKNNRRHTGCAAENIWIYEWESVSKMEINANLGAS
jgi:hypothetical protein